MWLQSQQTEDSFHKPLNELFKINNKETVYKFHIANNKRQQSFLQTLGYTTKRQYTNFLSSLALDINLIYFLRSDILSTSAKTNLRCSPSQNRIRKLYICLFLLFSYYSLRRKKDQPYLHVLMPVDSLRILRHLRKTAQYVPVFKCIAKI